MIYLLSTMWILGITLDLSRNLLTDISEGLPSNVVALNLSHNLLVDVEPGRLPPDLESLDISHNMLSVLPEQLISYLNKMKVLQMENNPINCNRLKSLNGLNKHLREANVSTECSSHREIGVWEIITIIFFCSMAIIISVIATGAFIQMIIITFPL